MRDKEKKGTMKDRLYRFWKVWVMGDFSYLNKKPEQPKTDPEKGYEYEEQKQFVEKSFEESQQRTTTEGKQRVVDTRRRAFQVRSEWRTKNESARERGR